MKVKVRRRVPAQIEKPAHRKTGQEAWAEFVKHYMPKEPGSLIDPTGTPLTPSFHGKDCLGNGEHPGIECCCDECDHYLTCFPDWKEHT